MKKLEIFDIAVNEIQVIEGLDAFADTLEEFWVNTNKISEWSSLEYLGKTMKKLNNLYIAGNPVHSRGQEFKDKLKESVPCLKELEGIPFDRPVYMYSNQPHSIIKKGINPKAKAILEDILGQ